MNRYFFFHGKPSDGETTAVDVFDGLEERIFKEFFQLSDTKSVTSFLVCEVRQWQDKSYSVYTYYADGRDNGGRANGYCALTLIVEEQYSQRVADIYSLLGMVYKKGLQQVLKYIDTTGRYRIDTFKGKDQLKVLENDVYRHLNENSFVTIGNDFHSFKEGEQIPLFNPLDVDSGRFLSDWKNVGKVYISSEFKSVDREMQELKKNSNLVGALQEKIGVLENDRQHLKSELESLRKQEEEKKKTPPIIISSESETLREENRVLREENVKLKDQLQNIDNEKPSTNSIPWGQVKEFLSGNTIMIWLPPLNLLLLCICLLTMWWGGTKINTISQSLKSDTDTTVVSNGSVSRNPISMLSQIKADTDFLKENSIKAMFAGVSVDIEGGGETTSINKECKLTLKALSSILNPQYGQWKVDGKGCSIVGKDTLRTPSYPVGSVVIYYEYKGIKVVERKIRIQ